MCERSPSCPAITILNEGLCYGKKERRSLLFWRRAICAHARYAACASMHTRADSILPLHYSVYQCRRGTGGLPPPARVSIEHCIRLIPCGASAHPAAHRSSRLHLACSICIDLARLDPLTRRNRLTNCILYLIILRVLVVLHQSARQDATNAEEKFSVVVKRTFPFIRARYSILPPPTQSRMHTARARPHAFCAFSHMAYSSWFLVARFQPLPPSPPPYPTHPLPPKTVRQIAAQQRAANATNHKLGAGEEAAAAEEETAVGISLA